MRMPITVNSDLFDIEKVQPDIDATQEAFTDYLNQVPRKSTKSKHGLMGPAGKILSEIKSGRRDPASLKGYALRVHEASLGRSPALATLESLEKGIDTIVALLNNVPPTFQDRVLDRLDYGLYFNLRKRQAESYAALRLAWLTYLRQKYGTDEALTKAWDESAITFDELQVPKKADGSRNKKAGIRQKDIAEFWESQGSSLPVEEEEE